MNLLLALTALPLLFTLGNSLSMRVVRNRDAKTIEGTVSVLIPVRNEERNIHGVLDSIIGTTFVPHLEILVLDDNSADDTAVLSREYLKVKTISGKELPGDWLGKNFACHQLVAHSSGEYLVFVDADVRLTGPAIASTISQMNLFKWDFISPYPKQIALTFFERLIQPLLQWSWLSSVPLRYAENTKFPSMIVANGQFMVIKRSAYLASGGHKEIRREVLDDLELARLLVRNGFRGGVAIGSDIATCRMYQNGTELFAGYTKSLWRAFGSPLGSILTSVFLFVTGVLPFLLAISGYTAGWIGYFLVVLSRYVSALRTRSFSAALLHPLSILTLIILISQSWHQKSTGKLTWRGRSVA